MLETNLEMNWLILPPCNDTTTNYKVLKENGKNAQKTMRLKIQCGLSLLNYKTHLIENFNISYYVRGQDGWMLAKFFLRICVGLKVKSGLIKMQKNVANF